MISKSIDGIVAADIQGLIDDESAESRLLEYKQSLPGTSDDEKREFLGDVTAFANASGGDLVYGVSEKKSEQGQNTGLPDKIYGIGSINPDAEWRRLEDILRNSIQPRIIGIQKTFIDCGEGLCVLVIRIPKSWQRPHMVTFKGLSRFYSRSSVAKYPMDVTELRHAFLESGSVAERLRLFVGDRIASISANDTCLPMSPSPKVVLFILPIGITDKTSFIDVKSIKESASDIVNLAGSASRRFYNIDGLISFTSEGLNSSSCYEYTQIYRNGAIESVSSSLLGYRNDGLISITGCERKILEATKQYMELLSRWNVALPYYVVLSLLGVKGMTLDMSSYVFSEQGQKITKDMLLMPDVIIEASDAPIDKLMRPAFDMIWQACGKRESPNYDKNETWVGAH